MVRAIDLYGEPQFGAVEVHNEASDDVLTAELEAGELAVAQLTPEPGLSKAGVAPHVPCKMQLFSSRGPRQERPIVTLSSSHTRPIGLCSDRLREIVIVLVDLHPSPDAGGGGDAQSKGWGPLPPSAKVVAHAAQVLTPQRHEAGSGN